MRHNTAPATDLGLDNLHRAGFTGNFVPVTLGKIVGGSAMVAAVCYFIHRKGPRQ